MGFLNRLLKSNSAPPTAGGTLDSLGQDLYAFGRFEIDPRAAAPDLVTRVGQIEPRYYPEAIADPALFTGRVAAAARVRGSWASYGGMRLVNSLLGSDAPGSVEVFELAFAFLRSRNLNFFYLAPVEIDWWVKHHRGEDYLTPRQLPPGPYAVAPLAEGERRHLVNMGPQGNNNDIYALANDGRFHSVVLYSGQSWEDSSVTESMDSLEQLYERLGEIVKYPRPGIDPQFALFCPLEPPDLSP